RLLARGHDERALYTLAMDVLTDLHRLPEREAIPEGVARYGTPRLLEEVSRIHTWYLPLVGAPPLNSGIIAEYGRIWETILPQAWRVPTTLTLFDFHVDNLMLLEGRAGMKACGLLDFQDAVAGPITYDI